MSREQGGFTLIELLIVVAIIAILAAIAVPNFLEAQVRSKVSRARADMRSIATGIEAYGVDHNRYPPNPDRNESFYVTPAAITTPIAYMSSWPVDPFKINRGIIRDINPANREGQEVFYDYYTIISSSQLLNIGVKQGIDVFILAADASGVMQNSANRGAFRKYGKWLQWSIGPDALFWNLEDDFLAGGTFLGVPATAYAPWGYSFDVPYDPTNGSVSFGNIIRSQANPSGTMPYKP